MFKCNRTRKKLQTNTISAERSTHIHEMGVTHAHLECREMRTLGQQAHRRQLAIGITVPRNLPVRLTFMDLEY